MCIRITALPNKKVIITQLKRRLSKTEHNILARTHKLSYEYMLLELLEPQSTLQQLIEKCESHIQLCRTLLNHEHLLKSTKYSVYLKTFVTN
jgi:hypothetical protein